MAAHVELVVRGEALRLHYEKVGSGAETVLLLPGALGSALSDFGPQLREGKLSADKYTLIGWDPPGYGQSRPPQRTWPTRWFERDAHAAKALLDALGVLADGKRVHLVGWSDGGNTALVLAALYPALVRSLVVFGGNAYVTAADKALYAAIADVDNWSERMRRPLEEMYGGRANLQALWTAWIGALSGYEGDDIVKWGLARVTAPALVVHGAKDSMVPDFHAQYIQQHLGNARPLVVWPNAKHNLHLRYADEFQQLVERFLDDVIAQPSADVTSKL